MFKKENFDFDLFSIFASQDPSHDINPYDSSFYVVDKVLDLINKSKAPKKKALEVQNKIQKLRAIYICSHRGLLPPTKFEFDDFITNIEDSPNLDKDLDEEDFEWERKHGVKYVFAISLSTYFRKFFSGIDSPLKNLKEKKVILDDQLCDIDGKFIQVWFKTKKEAEEFLKRFENYLRHKKFLMDEAKRY